VKFVVELWQTNPPDKFKILEWSALEVVSDEGQREWRVTQHAALQYAREAGS